MGTHRLVFINLCMLMLLRKVASALEELRVELAHYYLLFFKIVGRLPITAVIVSKGQAGFMTVTVG